MIVSPEEIYRKKEHSHFLSVFADNNMYNIKTSDVNFVNDC